MRNQAHLVAAMLAGAALAFAQAPVAPTALTASAGT